MRFISRSDMGWPPSAARLQPYDPDGTKVHYLGDKVSTIAHAYCVKRWTDIRNMHLANKEENYSDVAYNLAVCQHGYVLEGRGAGRQTGANGNQELNRQHYSIVVLIGGDTEPSSEALGALREAIHYLRSRGAGNEIKGHRDGAATSCPGVPLYNLVKSGKLEPNQEDDDMPSPEEIFSHKLNTPDGRYVAIADILAWTDNRHNALYAEIQELQDLVRQLLEKP